MLDIHAWTLEQPLQGVCRMIYQVQVKDSEVYKYQCICNINLFDQQDLHDLLQEHEPGMAGSSVWR